VSAGGVDYDVAAAAADGEAEEEAAMLAASIKVPKGFAIGSISSRSLGQGSANGSHPSLLQLLERDRQQQQQQREEEEPHQGQWCGQTSECSAGTSDTGSDNQEGFADAYLDPPVPSADQLSLFMEVQRFVGRRRLRPVLHCVLQRMVFAMPFDNRIRITLDTDVRTKALVSTRLGQIEAALIRAWRCHAGKLKVVSVTVWHWVMLNAEQAGLLNWGVLL